MSKKSKNTLTILILGLENAGKTLILFRLKFDEIVTTVPTDGFNFHNLEYKKTKIECYDYGGSKEVQDKRWFESIDKTNGIMWVVDASNQNTVKQSVETLASVIAKLPTQIPICVFANKYDLPSAMDTTEMTAEFARFSGVKVFHGSATEGSPSLTAALGWLVDENNGKGINKKDKKEKKEKKEKKDKKDKKKDKDEKKNHPLAEPKEGLSPLHNLNDFRTD